ncbi:uncharacterized protein LOC106880905 [Octopus bimaculoides]|uniref:uncharacterized protein LOC106880905 n=1 Tax=Octopus bimaculoides TaxID=37653 RepID=UPI00071C7C5B|nr:uncharacterized protein LOC106880905 [Octopus bimaculoides]|eukprot:XP_014786554.1 PREDICTED: uncharacterized protein LOC106880905 [Octopus bimaculoides]
MATTQRAIKRFMPGILLQENIRSEIIREGSRVNDVITDYRKHKFCSCQVKYSSAWRKKVFDIIHGLSHPDTKATRRLLSSKFIWHGDWTRSCSAYQQAKVHQHTKAPFGNYEPLQARFSHVKIDLVGPEPPSQGCSYLLTLVDRYTRWPEAIPLRSTETQEVSRAFIADWVARFSIPDSISSDGVHNSPRGCGITCVTFSKGLMERFHRRLKESLTTRLNGPN